MRYCKDCKFCHQYGNILCWKPFLFEDSMDRSGLGFNDNEYGGFSAADMRMNRLYCGPEGMWYEKKEVKDE